MFEFTDFKEATLRSVTARSEKRGDDDSVPALSIGVELTLPNTVLDLIEPTLRDALYRKDDEQEDIPDVEPSTPLLRANSIDRVALTKELVGWTLEVDDGIQDTSVLRFEQCKVDKLSFVPQTAGRIELRMRISTSDVDAERMGKMAMHLGQEIWITLEAPRLSDGSLAPEAQDEKDAGDLFAEQHDA